MAATKLSGVLALLAAVSAEPGGNCSLTGKQPRKARYLKFCQDYNSKACCIPGHDLENQVQFENLIEGLGPGCKNPMMYPEVRFFYCLGCDPDEPSYRNDEAETINICKTFLDKLWRDPAYDECGVMYSNPCPGDNWDFDPYQCGDTLLLPKQHFNNNVTAFINTFKPPGLEDFTFRSIDDRINPATGQRYDDTPCWIARTYSSSPAARTGGAPPWMTTALVAVAVAAVQLR